MNTFIRFRNVRDKCIILSKICQISYVSYFLLEARPSVLGNLLVFLVPVKLFVDSSSLLICINLATYNALAFNREFL